MILIKKLYEETSEIIDPHTIIGIAAGRKYMKTKEYKGEAIITLATAHPAKFPEAIKKSLGFEAKLPNFLADLADRKEKMEILPNDIEVVKKFIGENISK